MYWKHALKMDLEHRLASELTRQNPVIYLKNSSTDLLVDIAVAAIYSFTQSGRNEREMPFMADLITSIGNTVRRSMGLKKNSLLGAKGGAFILYSFQNLKIVETKLTAGRGKHNSYAVELINPTALNELWDQIPLDLDEKFPSLEPYAPWESAHHPTGVKIVKTNCKEVLSNISPEKQPLAFQTLNTAQSCGWFIEPRILEAAKWAMATQQDSYADIWELHDVTAKASKKREIQAVISMAERLKGHVFYHLYYFDFRYRKYPYTAFLHEQGSDTAKGMLRPADGVHQTERGLFWLYVTVATHWAGDCGREDGRKSDKIPRDDRYKWAKENEATFLSYAENPTVNKGWMEADAPWQFLAACIELKDTKDHLDAGHDLSEYITHFEGYLDGSNNGSQHLAALSRDEVVGKLVNLTYQEIPGDLYLHVGKSVWQRIQEGIAKIPNARKQSLELLIDTLISMKEKISSFERGDPKRPAAVDELKKFKEENKDAIKESSVVFWNRIIDQKHIRKILKRNVMTLAYGVTRYGMSEQHIKDARKHGIPLLRHLEHAWGAFLGSFVWENCKESIPRSMQLLALFENAGELAGDEERFLSWTVPITNCPVVQYYTEGTVKQIRVLYGPPAGTPDASGFYKNHIQLRICCSENEQITPSKQKGGASPNIIHSLDAAHLMLIVDECDFPVTTVHDSFGALLPYMDDLFTNTRTSFVRLHTDLQIQKIAEDIGTSIDGLDFGNLNINDVLDSEYAFI